MPTAPLITGASLRNVVRAFYIFLCNLQALAPEDATFANAADTIAADTTEVIIAAGTTATTRSAPLLLYCDDHTIAAAPSPAVYDTMTTKTTTDTTTSRQQRPAFESATRPRHVSTSTVGYCFAAAAQVQQDPWNIARIRVLIQGTVPTSVHHASCIHRSQRSCSKSANNSKIALHLKQHDVRTRTRRHHARFEGHNKYSSPNTVTYLLQDRVSKCNSQRASFGSLHVCCWFRFYDATPPWCLRGSTVTGSKSQARASVRWATGSRKSSTSFTDDVGIAFSFRPLSHP